MAVASGEVVETSANLHNNSMSDRGRWVHHPGHKCSARCCHAVPAGSYTASITSYGGATGTFSFRIYDLAAATAISYGQAVASHTDVSPEVSKAATFDFCEFQSATVAGTLFDDQNTDGVRSAGEAALGGWTVFLDLHGDNTLHGDDPSVVTGTDGRFSFSGIGPGVTRIGEVIQSGYARTTAESAISIISGYVNQNLDIGDVQTSQPKMSVSPAGLYFWT